LLEAKGPDDAAHRAAASLGLLPQVAWTDLDPEDAAPPGVLTVQLPRGSASGGPRSLRVALADPSEPEGAEFVAGLLALAATVCQRQAEAQRLQDAAHTDSLTGLWNRRGFEPFLDQAMARCHRTGENIAVLLCDVDHFKSINDVHGHDAGDEALQAVARAILTVIRPSDLAARLGGDELAILLSGCDAAGAERMATRLRQVLTTSVSSTSHVPPPTLSIGIADVAATFPAAPGTTARERILRAADEALYGAKKAGRNRAVVHPGCRGSDETIPAVIQAEEPTSPIELTLA
jgi:diguanylate cyclase (GGDEF)-like protein